MKEQIKGIRIKMRKKQIIKIFKIILLIIVLIAIIGLTIYLFPVVMNLSSKEGQIEFKEKVDNLGILSVLLIFGLQIAQIFLFIIPGEPIEILSGMCFGTLWGTIFIMISTLIISSAVFLLVRKYGKKFIYSFCKDERIEKIENSKLFKNPKRVEIVMFILFFIPGTPKDLLVYISGLLPLKPLRFLVISTIARFPSIISSTLAGANLVVGDWRYSLIAYGITFAIVGIIIVLLNIFDKHHTTKHIFKTLSKD